MPDPSHTALTAREETEPQLICGRQEELAQLNSPARDARRIYGAPQVRPEHASVETIDFGPLANWIGFHLRLAQHRGNRRLHQSERAIEIDAQRGPPLFRRHRRDGLVMRRPYPMVDDEAVHPSEGLNRAGDKRLAVLDGRELLAQCDVMLVQSVFWPRAAGTDDVGQQRLDDLLAEEEVGA